MVTMSDSENEDLLIEQAKKDNLHFKALLNLVPAHSYFSLEDKLEVFGSNTDEKDGVQAGKGKKRKKFKVNPFTTLSVTEILEMRQQGGLAGADNKNSKSSIKDGNKNNEKSKAVEEKHKNKKLSRNAKGNKHKGKEIERRDARLVELKEKLREKLEEIKAKKNSGNALSSQELKKLKRKEKKVNAKLKKTNRNIKEQKSTPKAESIKSPTQNKIPHQNGEQVKSKLDFSVISLGIDNSSRSSDLRGRDYKRLLEKVEKRKEKIDKLKEKDVEAGKRLEEKFQWQAALSKAKGEKVKDDPNLLKKAAKRKDKIKNKRKQKWDDRVTTVNELKQKRQHKRQANIDKRKTDKKDKKRKKLIKKGRIIPGL